MIDNIGNNKGLFAALARVGQPLNESDGERDHFDGGPTDHYDTYSAHKMQEHMDLALTARMMQRHKIPGHEAVFGQANYVLKHVLAHHNDKQTPLFHNSHAEALNMHKQRITDDINAHHDRT